VSVSDFFHFECAENLVFLINIIFKREAALWNPVFKREAAFFLFFLFFFNL